DSAERIPEEKPPPRHPRDPGHPRTGDPYSTEETGEEDGLATVLLEEPLCGRHHAVGLTLQPAVAFDQPAATFASEPVPDVVADDRRGCGNHDHADDREMPFRRVDTRGDQGRLAGKPEARGLQTDDPEQEPEPVRVDEVRHASPGYVRSRRANRRSAGGRAGRASSGARP